MEKEVSYLLGAYAGITVTDMLIKTLKLNSMYLKAKKESVDLKYKEGLMKINKKYLKTPLQMHIFVLLNLYKYSLVPGLNINTTLNIFDQENTFYEEYLNMFNYVHNDINETEEEERSIVAELISNIYEMYSDELPESYKGHKLDDESIRISRKEMIKFLKKYKIVLEEIPSDDEEYVDYNVMLLK